MTDVERLRQKIDECVSALGDEFPSEMVARALMCKGTDLILDANGIFAMAHTVARVQDLGCGRWTLDQTNSFIKSYR